MAARWWKERRGGGQCDTKDKGGRDNANELNFDSVGGVFVVLIAGMGCACAISVLEFIWKGASLEKKAKVKPASLVAKALYNTNSNLFNVAGIQKQTNTDQTACPHGRVTIPSSLRHTVPILSQKRSISLAVTPVPLAGAGAGGAAADEVALRSRQLSPGFRPSEYLDLTTDPYGPMSGPLHPPLPPPPLPPPVR